MIRLTAPRSALGAGLLALLAPLALAAQTTVTGDLALMSRYEWRGLTFTNRPVLQPDAIVTTKLGGGALATGAWANIELAGYNGPNDISVVGGQLGTAVSAYAFWSEYAQPVGRATLTAGVNGYVYPRANLAGPTYNSVEPYAKLALDLPLAPRLGVYYDAARIRGTYVEAAISQAVPTGVSQSVLLTATAGASKGEAVQNGGTQTAYYAADGFTALDLGASTVVNQGALSFTPSVHVTFGHDAYTRSSAPGVERGAKLWFGGVLSFTR
jgi:hypothetical protein